MRDRTTLQTIPTTEVLAAPLRRGGEGTNASIRVSGGQGSGGILAAAVALMPIARNFRAGPSSCFSTLGAALALFLALPALARADGEKTFNIERQVLSSALNEFARQSDRPILFSSEVVDAKRTAGVHGDLEPEAALKVLLKGTGLTFRTTADKTILVEQTKAGENTDTSKRLGKGGSDSPVRLAQATDPALSGDSSVEKDNDPQGSQKKTVELEQVVVTGSHIQGAKSASPVTVYTADQIERTGATTLDQFMTMVPQNFGGGATVLTANADAVASSLNFPGDTSANLHGLGPQATLTLINGERLAAGGLGTYTDISMIPLSAIDRIEILTDGASALYGSDAVAGVVNVVLKDHFSGAETQVDYGSIPDGGHSNTHLAQSIGTDWGAGGALGAFDYSRQFRLPSGDRAFTPTAALGSDLVPPITRESMFVAINNEFADRLTLKGDFLYSHKATDTIDVAFNSKGAREDQYSAVGTAQYRFSQAWSLSVTPNWSENRLLQIRYATPKTSFNENTAITNAASVTAVASGDLFVIPVGGVARLAAGAEYRNEALHYSSDINESALDLSRRRDISAGFAELNLPLVEKAERFPVEELSVILAGRFEHYSDFGDATTSKFGLRWKPVASLLFRATTGTSFRAPPLYYLGLGSSAILYPVPDPAAASGRTPSLILGGTGPNLRPESARSTTAGLEFHPSEVPSLSASMTLFQTHYFNRLQNPAPSFIGMLVNSADYPDFIIRNPTQGQTEAAIASVDEFANPLGIPLASVRAILNDFLQNVASVNVRGLDLEGKYSYQMSSGVVISSDLTGEYLPTFSQRLTPMSPTANIASTPYEPSRWKVRWDAGVNRRALSLSGAVNYVSLYTDNLVVPRVPVRSFTTVDCRASYEFFSDRSSRFGGLAVGLSVLNAFNTSPPLLPGSLAGYDSANANPFGRLITLDVRARY